MVTTIAESVQLIGILLRFLPKNKALLMVTDMEEEIAATTENVSLRDSIMMMREYLKDDWCQ